MCDDPEEAAQDEIGHAICLVTVNEFLQPFPEPAMAGSILPIGVDQYIDVREKHSVG